MPVSFFLDPAMLGDRSARTVRDMTLSYTFFKAGPPAPARAAKLATGHGESPTAATRGERNG
jgi:cytochrome c oxidase assembly protein Cox11